MLNKKSTLICLALLVASVFGLIAYSVLHSSKPAKSTPPTVELKTTPATSTPKSDQKLTAGGQPVPATSEAKAKELGYYCPSWDAASGTVASSVCAKLDQ